MPTNIKDKLKRVLNIILLGIFYVSCFLAYCIFMEHVCMNYLNNLNLNFYVGIIIGLAYFFALPLYVSSYYTDKKDAEIKRYGENVKNSFVKMFEIICNLDYSKLNMIQSITINNTDIKPLSINLKNNIQISMSIRDFQYNFNKKDDLIELDNLLNDIKNNTNIQNKIREYEKAILNFDITKTIYELNK